MDVQLREQRGSCERRMIQRLFEGEHRVNTQATRRLRKPGANNTPHTAPPHPSRPAIVLSIPIDTTARPVGSLRR